MDDNKKLNVILGIVCVVCIIISLYLGSIINNNENARIYFNLDDIKDINWIDTKNDISFKISNDKISFSIGDDVIVDNKSVTLNVRDGSFTYDGVSDKLYLRSVSSENIVIWYDKLEYRLTKEVINR